MARAEGDTSAESERFSLAISSEYPVERFFGTEILDHSPKSVDLKRLRNGGALLVDHDTRDHVGVIEEVTVGEDRVLRGVVRFGNSARAREIRQDVLDGIRRHVSVGYRVLRMKLESTGADGAPDVYRITRWEPLETSIVAVPADPSVGVGRAGEDGALPIEVESVESAPEKAATKERSMEVQTPAPAGADEVARMRVTERGEAAEIAALCAENGMAERTGEFLASGKSKAEVGLLILGEKRRGATATATAAGASTFQNLSDKERSNYCLTRAIMAAATGDWSKAGFERAVYEAEAKRLDRPFELMGRVIVPNDLPMLPRSQRSTLVAGTATVGGNIVFTEAGTFIDLLRNKMVVMQAGATYLGGLTGKVGFPRQDSAATLYWSGEAPGSDITASNPAFGLPTISGYPAQAQVPYSKQLLAQASPNVDDLVRRDLAQIHALGIDLVALKGTGTNQPTGIMVNTDVGSVTMGTNGLAPTYAKMVEMETTIGTANADQGSLAYVANAKVRGKLRTVEQFASTNGNPVWGSDGRLLGYPALVSNQIPSNLTKGTSTTICSAAIFGNWADLLIGEWGAFEIITDPLTLAGQGLIRLVSYQLVDVLIRHPKSFVTIQDILTT